MASPQVEDGHIKIACELGEALAKINLTAHESRILWCVLRLTYGWNKKTDRISYSQFAKLTGIDRRHIGRSLSSLKSRNILTCEKGQIITYGLQKNHELWRATDTIRGNSKLTPSQAIVTVEGDTIRGNRVTPSEAIPLTPSQAIVLTPSEAHTKAIKHIKASIPKQVDEVVLPEWIDKETWDAFLEVRKRKKTPNTAHALGLIIKELGRLKDTSGNNPNEVIEKSIMSGWAGVFPLKNNNGVQNGTNQGRNAIGGTKLPNRNTGYTEPPFNARLAALVAEENASGNSGSAQPKPEPHV